MVGSGPFYVKSLNPDGTSVLMPNKYFYGHKGHVKRILLIKYQDEESQLRDIKLGQIDAINSGVSSWATVLAGNPNVKLWASPSPGFNELAFNSCPPQGSPICSGPAPSVHTKVVQNLAIRHALQYAINRTEIDTVVWHDLSGPEPGDGIISPIYKTKGYFKDWSKDPELGYNYDPEKAKQVLADGGWKCPANGGTCTQGRHQGRVHAGRPLELERGSADGAADQGMGGRGRHQDQSLGEDRGRASTPRSTPPRTRRSRRTRASTSRPTTPSCGAGAATLPRLTTTSTS